MMPGVRAATLRNRGTSTVSIPTPITAAPPPPGGTWRAPGRIPTPSAPISASAWAVVARTLAGRSLPAPALGEDVDRRGQQVDEGHLGEEVVAEGRLGLGDRVLQGGVAAAVLLEHRA